MEKKDFTTSIIVNKDISSAFKLIKNFRAWWSEEIEGDTEKLGETFFYHYKDVHLCKIKLIDEVPDKILIYQVIDNEFNFTKDKTEWINTKLIFDLSTEGDKTKIVFTHEGLVPEYECYNVCHDAWTSYIQVSLKNFIETGRGKPNGKEGGLNAELVEKWGLPNENTLKKNLRTCKFGHQYYKSSDCPTCPICEKAKKPKEGFLSKLAAPARRALENADIKTLKQLAKYTESDILKLHGIGKTTIPTLKTELEKAGLSFKD